MTTAVLPTQFAPAERMASETVREQSERIAHATLFRELLEAIPDLLMVLNAQRQIVFCNQRLLTFLGLSDAGLIYGLRPGEVLNCVHAAEAPAGCGTSQFCSTCGAVRAILSSQQGHTDVQECRITQCSGEALDLRVWAKPVTLDNELYTLFTVLDIRDEKRRQVLERIFFHDVLNTASNLQGYSSLLKDSASPDEQTAFTDTIHQLALELIEEIQAQRDLLSAENQELTLRLDAIDAVELLQSLAREYAQRQKVMAGCAANIVVDAAPASLISDRVLLRRVVGNMLKNALEASAPGETVTLSSRTENGRIIFTVHNIRSMPLAVQLQVFQRSYSTKGTGRGLGTYSMKLLSERFLKGTITFTSSAQAGTTFIASFPPTIMETADLALPGII